MSEADDDVRRLLLALAGHLGHRPHEVTGDGAGAPAADALLLDPTSPLCVAQAQAICRSQPEIPVVAMGRLAGLELPGHHETIHLPKPFRAAQLETALARALDAAPE